MIPLGSCTMKLNATSEMFPVIVAGVSRSCIRSRPTTRPTGYREMFRQLEDWLAEITGFAAVSLQPNAGSQGEYAGLLVIREYHEARGEGASQHLPHSRLRAHGTNPASAVMAGMKVVPVRCLDGWQHRPRRSPRESRRAQRRSRRADGHLSVARTAFSRTTIREICEIVHAHGGQVYMDGANMNAQVGLCRPGDIGADVCHLNLHKTFCIPHGGGGPGMGPIGVAAHLVPFLPGPRVDLSGRNPGSAAGLPPRRWAARASSRFRGCISA